MEGSLLLCPSPDAPQGGERLSVRPWHCIWGALADRTFCLQGIFISRVAEEGPAARAGVRVGDKLLEVSDDEGWGADRSARVGADRSDSGGCIEGH